MLRRQHSQVQIRLCSIQLHCIDSLSSRASFPKFRTHPLDAKGDIYHIQNPASCRFCSSFILIYPKSPSFKFTMGQTRRRRHPFVHKISDKRRRGMLKKPTCCWRSSILSMTVSRAPRARMIIIRTLGALAWDSDNNLLIGKVSNHLILSRQKTHHNLKFASGVIELFLDFFHLLHRTQSIHYFLVFGV